MGPVAPVGAANPGHAGFPPNRRAGGSAASVMLLRKCPCVKGLAVRQVAWYQRSAERIDNCPLVWCWDNLSIHLAPELAEFAEENKAWLRIYRLPAYTPDLN